MVEINNKTLKIKKIKKEFDPGGSSGLRPPTFSFRQKRFYEFSQGRLRLADFLATANH